MLKLHTGHDHNYIQDIVHLHFTALFLQPSSVLCTPAPRGRHWSGNGFQADHASSGGM